MVEHPEEMALKSIVSFLVASTMSTSEQVKALFIDCRVSSTSASLACWSKRLVQIEPIP
jgi:hypothetical protein